MFCRYADGWWYCGESDAIGSRVKTHRNHARQQLRKARQAMAASAPGPDRHSAAAGPDGPASKATARPSAASASLMVAYVPLPAGVGAKSLTRRLQGMVIKAMQEAGYPMLSTNDARLRSFGR